MRNIDEKNIAGFSLIHANSIEDEKSDSFPVESSLPALGTNSAHVASHSISMEEKDILFSTQEKGSFLFSKSRKILLTCYFCSDIVFNLSRKVLIKIEIKWS